MAKRFLVLVAFAFASDASASELKVYGYIEKGKTVELSIKLLAEELGKMAGAMLEQPLFIRQRLLASSLSVR